MTNLQLWILYAALFAIPYVGLLLGSQSNNPFIQFLPFIALVLFGVYSAIVVLYRTFTFNDCPNAAKELQEQIQEARRDLIAKGFKFRD